MSVLSDPQRARSAVGVAVSRGDVEAERIARQNLNEAKVGKAIREGLACEPTLTADARVRLAQLLLAGEN